MSYRELFKKENDRLRERYDLAAERIALIVTDHTVSPDFEDYFLKTANFILMMDRLILSVERDELIDADIAKLKHLHDMVYRDIVHENYKTSYANPIYAVRVLGQDYGLLLSALYAKLRLMIIFAWECRRADMTIYMELFIEIYNYFETEKMPDPKLIRQALYWFISDYSDVTLSYRLREQIDDSLDFITDIVMNKNLEDDGYLYRYGSYIGSHELNLAAMMRRKTQSEIDAAALEAAEDYVCMAKKEGVDTLKEKTVHIRFDVGLERLVRAVVLKLQSYGFKTILGRQYDSSAGNMYRYCSRFGVPLQYAIDHRCDEALFLDKALTERRLSVLKVSCENMKALAKAYTGTIYFTAPQNHQEISEIKNAAPAFNEKQVQLAQKYLSRSREIIDRYMPCHLSRTVSVKD
ncbi:MAG: hypothetical protein MRZ59_06700 [Clostridiales bacterium]|nr:hypothetical protein [Clostridiales bacterium]MDY3746073.1 hypothetical protein [Lachnospiraceae bacterium]